MFHQFTFLTLLPGIAVAFKNIPGREKLEYYTNLASFLWRMKQFEIIAGRVAGVNRLK